MRVANPAQSLHALTVGSVAADVFEDANARSFAAGEHHPSGFSRAGYGEPWSVVKPEVVEIGGDLVYSKNPPRSGSTSHPEVAIELLNSTMHGAPAYSKDGAGTSFAAPKVAHIAAHLQNLFPDASPLLYRALIVQSARWPVWTENEADRDKVLKLIGYGLPSLERATSNSETRVTLITPDAEILPSKQLHLYTIRIPEELRSAALEAKIRIDVTLAYTALPRRTRARRTGYLETWLDWETSKLGEPMRRIFDAYAKWRQIRRSMNSLGLSTKAKAWAKRKKPAAIAARAKGLGNHSILSICPRNLLSPCGPTLVGTILRSCAKLAIALSFPLKWSQGEVPIYSLIESEIQVAEAETEVRVQT